MKLSDFLFFLKKDVRISLLDKNNKEICKCTSSSKGILPYREKNVIEWNPVKGVYTDADLIIIIDDEEAVDGEKRGN